MKRVAKALLTAIMVFVLVASSIGSAYADSWKNESGKKSSVAKKQEKKIEKALSKLFKDVENDFWAYKAIEELVKRGVINGYSDNTFKPNGKVTRSEFASMLTKALDLEAEGSTQTFVDVSPKSWDYKAVEASKEYLTGYMTASGKMYFYGSKNAVREDMAVALVKALNLTLQSDNGQLKEIFKDYNSISENLRDYVYTAYKEEIMIGSNGRFAPQNTLSRAEAATLLKRALEKTEKVVVDDNGSEKVIVDDSRQPAVKSSNATLSDLKVNGTTIAGFAPNVYVYELALISGNSSIPSVSAAVYDTGKATGVITQAASLPGTATVEVTAEDQTTKNTYKINLTVVD